MIDVVNVVADMLIDLNHSVGRVILRVATLKDPILLKHSEVLWAQQVLHGNAVTVLSLARRVIVRNLIVHLRDAVVINLMVSSRELIHNLYICPNLETILTLGRLP